MVKLLIIDDHPLIIDGIRAMLKDTGYLEITAACKTAGEGLGFITDHPEIDIILLDINLPDMDGLRLCELIRQTNKQVRIIGLTYVNEAGIITQLIRRGANGYLLKNMEREEFIEAIDRVMDGGLYLSKGANEKILQQLRDYELPGNKIPALTRREMEILQLLNKGFTSQDIAGKLFLSVHTIDTHRKNMLQKFNVHNTQALMNIVRELKVLS